LQGTSGHSTIASKYFRRGSDYIIDLGPEGGDAGGEVIFAGTPEELAECDKSYTAKFLKPML
jgi:excinuclease ABC subunit A